MFTISFKVKTGTNFQTLRTRNFLISKPIYELIKVIIRIITGKSWATFMKLPRVFSQDCHI